VFARQGRSSAHDMGDQADDRGETGGNGQQDDPRYGGENRAIVSGAQCPC